MVRITLRLFEDIQEELEGYNYSPAELKQLGEKIKERMDRLAHALSELEKTDWQWTTSYKNILLWKKTTMEQAREEIKKLHIDHEILEFEDF